MGCWWFALGGAVGLVALMGLLLLVLLYIEKRDPDPLRNRERVGQ